MTDSGSQRPNSTVERRKSERADIEVRVDYSTVDDFFTEFSQNINEGGMFIETESPAELESQVQLRFSLPGDSEPVKTSGRVVRIVAPGGSEPAGMAVEFEELDATARARIDAIVKQLRADRPA